MPDERAPWPSAADPLGEALHFLELRGAFYCRSEFTAPFGLELPPLTDHLWFHVITRGSCWLDAPGAQPRRLTGSELALVPHGQGHRLRSEPDAPTPSIFELEREQLGERYEILRHGGGGERIDMVCGAVRSDHPAAGRLLALLPQILVLDPATDPARLDWIQSTLRLMAVEADGLRPGGETVITRLSDVLVVQALRAWLENDPAARSGWLGALRDPLIGRAISLIHREPGRHWTVASLAEKIPMSRSAFAARFTELVGEPAMSYVTRWRMHLAATALRDEGATVAELASRFGYRSEAAFARAFKRVVGSPPGAARRTLPAPGQQTGSISTAYSSTSAATG
ncbi:AraC family transcriptional regulator [Micromonospora sp. NPDC049060]|uniref:AraC family transcriptional regulator n=1 Tax=Micromonospora sp. NPDC049060 TaxID=3154828 RepID=UPI0033F52BE7